ncbi:hypothetical protein R1flu_004566 [Riccia fluitans]|uniref:Uncharacterized protein n=1 Tax=Riccia fluitans TaxID=41844 RepID=A0ABD1YTR3_9MARC
MSRYSFPKFGLQNKIRDVKARGTREDSSALVTPKSTSYAAIALRPHGKARIDHKPVFLRAWIRSTCGVRYRARVRHMVEAGHGRTISIDIRFVGRAEVLPQDTTKNSVDMFQHSCELEVGTRRAGSV